MTLEEVKETGLYPEDFREDLAPERYHFYKNRLDKVSRDILVAYGLRRSGKTYALIKLGELAEKLGYKMLYYELERLDENFIPYKKAGKLGKQLVDLVEQGNKLFIILDEAFNIPITSVRAFIGPFRLLDKGFVIAFSGSYTYDLLDLRAEITRIFPKKARDRVFNVTLPRSIKRQEGLNPAVLNAIRPNIPENPAPHVPVNYQLFHSLGLVESDLTISEKVIENYSSILKTGGIPLVIKGKASLDDIVDDIVELLVSSLSSDIEYYKIKISDSIEGDRPTSEELVELLKKYMRSSTRGVEIKLSSLLHRIALSTGLILPRRNINENDFGSVLRAIRDKIVELKTLSTIKGYPIPSSYLSYRVLTRLGAKMPYSGVVLEAILANSLVSFFSRFISNADMLMRRVPIFSTSYIDFLLNIYADDIPILYLIEVKSSLSDIEAIRRTLKKASSLLTRPIIAVPGEETNYKLPLIIPESTLVKFKPSTNAIQIISADVIGGVRKIEMNLLGIRLVYRYENVPEEFAERISDTLVDENLLPPIIMPIELLTYLFPLGI